MFVALLFISALMSTSLCTCIYARSRWRTTMQYCSAWLAEMNNLGLCDEPRTVAYSSSDGQLFDSMISLFVLFESGRFGVEPTRKEKD